MVSVYVVANLFKMNIRFLYWASSKWMKNSENMQRYEEMLGRYQRNVYETIKTIENESKWR